MKACKPKYYLKKYPCRRVKPYPEQCILLNLEYGLPGNFISFDLDVKPELLP